jgi:hypothetical protein
LPTAISRALTAPLTAEQIRAHTYPRLSPIDQVPPEERLACAYARPFGVDFVELLVHQDGECLQRLTDEDVAKVGAPDLFELARARLRELPAGTAEVVRRDGGEFHVLRGASEFTASRLLLLPEVFRSVVGRTIDEVAGALVSVPSRHEMCFAPVDETIAATLVHLSRYTLMTYDDCRHPLSSTTYWWQDGTLAPVVTLDPDGFVDFRMPPAFMDAAGSSDPDSEADVPHACGTVSHGSADPHQRAARQHRYRQRRHLDAHPG